jgi:ABC-type uncharacterized transport system substrate-binding protein
LTPFLAGMGSASESSLEQGPSGLMAELGRRTTRRIAAFAVALACLAPAVAHAHPHVWITVRTQVVFSPDGKVASLVHDWVFDEMYSAFAIQGLAPPGELVKRETFAPLAKENAGGLADIGYFTTLKLDGKAVEFAPVTDYWMEERPDHLVAFHVVLPLKTPQTVGRFGSLMVADPEFFIDFEFDDKDGVIFRSAPAGCSNSYAKPKPLDGGDKKTLDESFFSGLAPGTNFGFKMASRVILACP